MNNYIIQEIDGKRYQTDTTTGVTVELMNIDIPVGSRVYTPEQIKDDIQRKESYKKKSKGNNILKQ